MKIMFWNTRRNAKINEYIASLVYDNNIDILVLAEYTADGQDLKRRLFELGCELEECMSVGCERINIWSNFVNVQAGLQNKFYSIQIFKGQFILCGVHLMSDLHGDKSKNRHIKMRQIISDIENVENSINSKRSIIIGDFNEMPYGEGCLSADGFHGLPVLNAGDKPMRTIDGIEYRKFYNPMWNLMGDFSYPPGTHYYASSDICTPMWYMLDQIIISKEVIPIFVNDSLKIVTSCSFSGLMDKNGHPDKEKISDHFPIICEIKE